MTQFIEFTEKFDPVAADRLFKRGYELDEGAHQTAAEAIATYQEAIGLDPRKPGPCVNLGTIYYEQKNFLEAEKWYRKATERAPDYALAWFDLGGVLEDLSKQDMAISAYERAVALVPHYADAHYNLALIFQKRGQKSEALKHWTAYLKYDEEGPWAEYARKQADIIQQSLEPKCVDGVSKAQEQSLKSRGCGREICAIVGAAFSAGMVWGTHLPPAPLIIQVGVGGGALAMTIFAGRRIHDKYLAAVNQICSYKELSNTSLNRPETHASTEGEGSVPLP
jgi:tetratricopeptide (TPR) repeat protein